MNTGRTSEHGLAPAVESDWVDEFLLELRLLGVSGARIGDALSEVQSHCEESGESALSSFGDPAAYARSLQLPAEEKAASAAVWACLPTLLQLGGMASAHAGLLALKRSELIEVTVGRHFHRRRP